MTVKKILLFLAVALLQVNECALSNSDSAQTNNSPVNIKAFDIWATLAQGKWISPVWEQGRAHDIKTEWIGPDGKNIKLIVRQPIGAEKRKKVTLAPIKPDEDARPFFEKAIAKARQENANTLSINPGIYNFLTTEKNAGAHLLLENLKDFIIEGNGAQLSFSQNSPGMLIRQSQRIRIENLHLSFSLRSTSLGTIQLVGDKKKLVIDAKFPVTENDKIYQISEIDPVKLQFIPGGVRIITAPENELPVFDRHQAYSAKSFQKLKIGSRFLIIHQWYGGSAIKIDGTRNKDQTEDISITGVNIHSTPGMGIAITGLKRGFAVTDSSFCPDPKSSNIAGPAWDGLHIVSGGGDILISRNRFTMLGDDAMNLNNPIHSIASIARENRKLILSKSSRFVAKGDTLAFFDEHGGYIGKSAVAGDTVDKGRGNFEVSVDALPAEVSEKSFVRDLELIGSRFAVTDNAIEDLNGHGVLAQIPNGLIAHNSFQRLNRNAIRLLSSVGTWNEGVGAFNVAVRDNVVENGGVDSGMDIPWSAITVYGQRRGGNLSEYLFNENIEISGNRLKGLKQSCIGVANSRKVLLKNNLCETGNANTVKEKVKIIKSLGVSND